MKSRKATHPGSEVGITLNFSWVESATNSGADRMAAQWADGYSNRWFLDPVYGRYYPADMVAAFTAGGLMPNGLDFVQPGDMEVIATNTDFLGVNYYTREVVKAESADKPLPTPARELATLDRTEMDWEVYPNGLYKLLCRLYFDYDIPKLYITENGCSYSDGPGTDGKIHDVRRTEYLRSHFLAAHRAMLAGVPLAGYFVWSLMDNFEWAKGYTQRFGMVYVDYATQQRTPKDSARWYQQFLQQQKKKA